MGKRITTILFVLIVLFGSFLRLWHLGTIPPSPDWDEAALAYNAHSLAQTGKDEYGTVLPIILRSYNDYKPGVYAYIAIPFVETIGLNTFAIRLPSALFGIIAIIAVYFLARELFARHKHKKAIALLAAFLLAISPWHIQFSRVAFETNVGLTCNILVALFFIKGLKKHWLLLLAALLTGLNLSVYQSERVFTPLLVITLIIIYRKELFAVPKKYFAAATVIAILTVLPALIFFAGNHNALERVKGTSIFNNQTEVLKKSINRLADDKANHDVVGILLDNRRLTYGKEIIDAYISHFSPKWLFITGDINRHHAPEMGLIYIVFLPFILLGMYTLLFGEYDKKTKYLIFAWFLLAAVPASITTGVPHAVRTLNFLPTYEIFIALGLLTAFMFLNKKRALLYAVGSLFFVLFIFNFVYYLNQYFVQQNFVDAFDWQYGYEQAVPAIEQVKGGYNKILVSDRQPLDESYMFFLFYLQYPPAAYQKVANQPGDHKFDKYEFHSFDWHKEIKNEGELLVGGPNDFPKNIVTKKIIPYPNGTPAILIVDPKDNRNL
jgi:4-amino-4-deoxy-L-arabinose transferase-like glycosyltransferase